MPGLYGTLTHRSQAEVTPILREMTAHIGKRPLSLSQESRNGFGISVGLRNTEINLLPGGGLWSSDDGSLVAAIDGEIYELPEESEFGKAQTPSSNAEIVGSLYRSLGPLWARAVNGAFSAVVFDSKAQTITISTDRLSLRPLFVTLERGELYWGSELAAFQAGRNVTLDERAIVELLAYEHVFDCKSLLKNISRVPPGTVISYRLGDPAPKYHTYWSTAELAIDQTLTFDSAAEEASTRFLKSLKNLTSDSTEIGVYLTSGLDSRLIAGCLTQSRRDYSTATYGISGCRDMVWGKELANLGSSKHLEFPLDNAGWVFEYADHFQDIAEAFVSPFHSHGISTYPDAARAMHVHLSGYGGGSFAGCDTSDLTGGSFDKYESVLENQYRSQLGNAFRTNTELNSLLEARFSELNPESLFRETFGHFREHNPETITDSFNLRNRYQNMFAFMIKAERDYIEDRSPFLDFNFLSFVMSIPSKHRAERRLQLAMLDRLSPRFTEVPWQVSCDYPTLRPGRHFTPNATKQLPTEPGRNYPLWLHQAGATWLKKHLDTGSVAKHGIFRPTALLALVDTFDADYPAIPYAEKRLRAFQIATAVSIQSLSQRIFG